MTDSHRAILLTDRPRGKLNVGHFREITLPPPGEPGPGEVLCRTILLSISPGSRAWMQQSTYRDELRAGEPMSGYTLAEVVAENGTGITPGTIVSCEGAWQTYSLLSAASVQRVDVRGPLTHHMSVFGATGLTAYFGMHGLGTPRRGETVVVSAAAGATGSVAGQIARRAGARVVGITGSDAKNRLLEAELGFDATVNHRSASFEKDLAEECGGGIDVYFDSVGGRILEAALHNMNLHGRVVCCGAVSQYDGPAGSPGPANVPTVLVTKRLAMQGFIVFDFAESFPAALSDLEAWVSAGDVKVLEDVREGLQSAPSALVDLLSGGNVGKLMVRVGPDS
ncbi:NADP-dependent oxidoreductase (plasmid) [Rhodococcus erythropolis]|nr:MULTISPECIES: NADP-dependent oxidoreductase [Rhodococcus]MCJ0949868.1 NADP-dependent oxidoreductase [Rhodococcus sp. ARC_M8]MCQ4152136.1 NADP-dependent oxidoreductase [Rhodococcus qingshengii]MDJ0441262.1 NADP-dependent oxidoreductase [Rhodococcus qingshengii]QEX08466.1 NADP-dependent oxidoreductase [Rhodococcus erythropolis]